MFIISSLGFFGVVAIVFAESGLFFGFFFPGDSLLFTAGLLASQDFLNIWWLLPGVVVAAILGDNVGYWFGQKVGPKIFSRPNSLFFKQEYIDKTQRFYAKHGKKTIILARFVPIVRTFAPILAGVGQMPYRVFFFYNCVGGFLWGGGVTLAGYVLGGLIPGLDQYILPIVLLIFIVSFLPILLHRGE